MAVRVSNGGANNVSSDRYEGWTVGDVRSDSVTADLLNLTGDESASVGSGADRSTVDDDYVLEAGDVLSFSRQAGNKGV